MCADCAKHFPKHFPCSLFFHLQGSHIIVLLLLVRKLRVRVVMHMVQVTQQEVKLQPVRLQSSSLLHDITSIFSFPCLMEGVSVSGEWLFLLALECAWARFRWMEVWLGLEDCLPVGCVVVALEVLPTLRRTWHQAGRDGLLTKLPLAQSGRLLSECLAPVQSRVSTFRGHGLNADLEAGMLGSALPSCKTGCSSSPHLRGCLARKLKTWSPQLNVSLICLWLD